jgi:hypothetical protein
MFVHVLVGTVFTFLVIITYQDFDIDFSFFENLNIYLYLTIFYFSGLVIERFSSSIFERILRIILPKKLKNHKEILKAKITSKRYEIHIRNYAMNRSFIVAFIVLLLYGFFADVNIQLKLSISIVYLIVIVIFTIHSAKLITKINDYYE